MFTHFFSLTRTELAQEPGTGVSQFQISCKDCFNLNVVTDRMTMTETIADTWTITMALIVTVPVAAIMTMIMIITIRTIRTRIRRIIMTILLLIIMILK